FFYYSTMSAGKSMEIIKVAYNYQVQGKKVVTMNSALDNRYAQGKIWSRAGFSIDAHIYEANTNIKNFITSFDELPASLLIDEAQFLSEAQVIQLTELADDYGITVMCYGLKNDAFNHLFEGSQNLLIYADNIKELKTEDRKSTRLNSSHVSISYAVFCLKKKNTHKLFLNSNIIYLYVFYGTILSLFFLLMSSAPHIFNLFPYTTLFRSQLTELADDYGITVMCYGLKNDAFNHLFEGSQNLLIYADNIKELKT